MGPASNRLYAPVMKRRLSPPVLFLVMMALGCQTTEDDSARAACPPINAGSLGEMRNVSTMGSISFGALPCEEDMGLARRRGIERVIDLSSPDEKGRCNLAAVCTRMEIEYMPSAIRSEGPPSDESVDFVMECLIQGCSMNSDPDKRAIPTLMVDGSGGRSASFLAIYRVCWLGVPLEEALVEARRAGMRPGDPEAFVRVQVERIEKERAPVTE